MYLAKLVSSCGNIKVCQSPLPRSILHGEIERVLWKEKSHSLTERHTDMKATLYIKG